MSALLLDGKSLAADTEAELKVRVASLKQRNGGQSPILATILVGTDPASATYVKMKGNACARVGMESLKVELPDSTKTAQLLETINELNANSHVHGILLQHPVPSQIDERALPDLRVKRRDLRLVAHIAPARRAAKDLDHPLRRLALPLGEQVN